MYLAMAGSWRIFLRISGSALLEFLRHLFGGSAISVLCHLHGTKLDDPDESRYPFIASEPGPRVFAFACENPVKKG